MHRRIPAHLQRIHGVPLFAACSARELARVDALSMEVTVGPRTVLQREGAAVDQFGVVVDGLASASVAGEDVEELHAGMFFGAAGLLERLHAAATVTTSAPTVVRVFGRNEFRALVETVEPVRLALSRDNGSDARHRPAPAEAVGRMRALPSGAPF